MCDSNPRTHIAEPRAIQPAKPVAQEHAAGKKEVLRAHTCVCVCVCVCMCCGRTPVSTILSTRFSHWKLIFQKHFPSFLRLE